MFEDLISTEGKIFIQGSSSLNLTATAGNVNIESTNGTKITSGTFALVNGTTVNNIVTVLDGLNREDDLVTEGAVLDLVSGLAGSGLTFNGTSIDLGGLLTIPVTTISTQLNNDLLIDGGGGFNVMTNQVDITSINGNSLKYYDQAESILTSLKGQDVSATVKRGSENIDITLKVPEDGVITFPFFTTQDVTAKLFINGTETLTFNQTTTRGVFTFNVLLEPLNITSSDYVEIVIADSSGPNQFTRLIEVINPNAFITTPIAVENNFKAWEYFYCFGEKETIS